jgi:DNA-binding protein HU-beta
MNKSHLINHVADELRTSKLQAALLVETVLDGIKKGLETDQSVTLTGFGTFQLKARVGRYPHSGEPIEIGPGLRVGFRVGKAPKESF